MTNPTSLEALRTEPANVADAIDRIARIKTVSKWLSDLEAPVRDWLTGRAIAIEQDMGGGAAFRTEVPDLGRVAYTNPQPTPQVDSPNVFARWYVREIVGRVVPDDHDDELDLGRVVLRRTVSTPPQSAVETFVDQFDEAGYDPADPAARDAAAALRKTITVGYDWWIDDGLLDDLLDGKVGTDDEAAPRLKIHAAGDGSAPVVVDTTTGEPVPGVTVRPAAQRVLQVTPDADAKKRLRAELDQTLGPPALTAE